MGPIDLWSLLEKFIETFNGPCRLCDALIEYLQEVELLQDVELLQEHLKVLALFNACSGRFKVGLNDLSLVYVGRVDLN